MRSKIYREWQRRRDEDAKLAYQALMKFYPLTLDDLEGEEWRDIANYEGDYQVSNFGRVKSFLGKETRILKPRLLREYLAVILYKGGKQKNFYIHRLVGQAFILNLKDKPEINHEDGIKFNCHVSNLTWATSAENNRHAVDMGLRGRGEDNPRAKLSGENAVYIRENPDGLTIKELAETFGVTENTISLVQRAITYKNAGGTIRKAKPRAKPRKYTSRISDEIREEIRRLYVKGSRDFGAHALAKRFGFSKTTILKIVAEGLIE